MQDPFWVQFTAEAFGRIIVLAKRIIAKATNNFTIFIKKYFKVSLLSSRFSAIPELRN
jgi:hypothetical protein